VYRFLEKIIFSNTSKAEAICRYAGSLSMSLLRRNRFGKIIKSPHGNASPTGMPARATYPLNINHFAVAPSCTRHAWKSHEQYVDPPRICHITIAFGT
jgi:hypothetical protein